MVVGPDAAQPHPLEPRGGGGSVLGALLGARVDGGGVGGGGGLGALLGARADGRGVGRDVGLEDLLLSMPMMTGRRGRPRAW